MANTEITYLDFLITSPDALDNSFTIKRTLSPNAQEHALVIEVTAGSVQFCLGQPVGPNSPVHAAGSRLVFTVYSMERVPVYYKASAGGDQFSVNY